MDMKYLKQVKSWKQKANQWLPGQEIMKVGNDYLMGTGFSLGMIKDVLEFDIVGGHTVM